MPAVKAVYHAAVEACGHGIDILAGLKTSMVYKHRIRRMARDLRAPAFRYRSRFHPDYSDTSWHRAYAAANGIVSDDYVPEDLFYVNIEPRLSPLSRTKFYTDKNNLDKLRFPCRFPLTLGRIVAGNFLDAGYSLSHPEQLADAPMVAVKPAIQSGGGRDIQFLPGPAAARFAGRTLREHPAEEFIFQDVLRQSAWMSRLAPDSINTVRLMTLLRRGRAEPVAAALRMGRNGSRVDNITAGGISCGVRDGALIASAYDADFGSYDRHPDTGTVFRGFKVPGYGEAEALCLRLHSLMPEIGLVSWDIAFDEDDQPVVVEINLDGQEINFLQLAHGPLFGTHFPEILERTRPQIRLGCPIR